MLFSFFFCLQPLLRKPAVHAFVREAGGYLKSDRRSAKLNDNRVAHLRQSATDAATGAVSPLKLLEQLAFELRRVSSHELIDDTDVAVLATKVSLFDTGCPFPKQFLLGQHSGTAAGRVHVMIIVS